MLYLAVTHKPYIVPIWAMREEDQAAIIAALASALIAAIAAVVVVLIRWHLDQKDAKQAAQSAANEREKEAADHAKEVAELKKQGAYKEIETLKSDVQSLRANTSVLSALRQGVQNLEFAKLQQLHDRLADNGWLSDSAKQVADRVYLSYHALGGNGLGTAWHKDIMDSHSQLEIKENQNDKHTTGN